MAGGGSQTTFFPIGALPFQRDLLHLKHWYLQFSLYLYNKSEKYLCYYTYHNHFPNCGFPNRE